MVDCTAGGRQDLLGSVYSYFGLLGRGFCLYHELYVGWHVVPVVL